MDVEKTTEGPDRGDGFGAYIGPLFAQGTADLLEAAGDRALPVIPQLIVPLKTALDTRDPQVAT